MKEMQIALGWLLRIGVFLALLLVVSGGIIYLIHYGQMPADFHTFHGEPQTETSIVGILGGAWGLHPRDLIQLGILVLIVTQILRVVFVAWFFAKLKDYKFTLISLFVLVAILIAPFAA